MTDELEEARLKLAAVVHDNLEQSERLSVLQRQASDLAERLRQTELECDQLAERHRVYADGIASALGDRELRSTGEPARSDREEIAMLRHRAFMGDQPSSDRVLDLAEQSAASTLIAYGFKVQALSLQQEIDLGLPAGSVRGALARVFGPAFGPALASAPIESVRLLLREPAWAALRGVRDGSDLYDCPRTADGLQTLGLIQPIGGHEWQLTERGSILLRSQRKVDGALDFLHRVRTQTGRRHVLATEIDEQLGVQHWTWNAERLRYEVQIFRGLLTVKQSAVGAPIRMNLDDAVQLVVAGYEALKLAQGRTP